MIDGFTKTYGKFIEIEKKENLSAQEEVFEKIALEKILDGKVLVIWKQYIYNPMLFGFDGTLKLYTVDGWDKFLVEYFAESKMPIVYVVNDSYYSNIFDVHSIHSDIPQMHEVEDWLVCERIAQFLKDQYENPNGGSIGIGAYADVDEIKKIFEDGFGIDFTSYSSRKKNGII